MSRSKRSRSPGGGARIETRFRFVLMRVPDRRRPVSSEADDESTGTSWSQWIKPIAVRRLRISETVAESRSRILAPERGPHDRDRCARLRAHAQAAAPCAKSSTTCSSTQTGIECLPVASCPLSTSRLSLSIFATFHRLRRRDRDVSNPDRLVGPQIGRHERTPLHERGALDSCR